MSDRLYLSFTLPGFGFRNMFRHFERMIGVFPFSRQEARVVLKTYAIEFAEPPAAELVLECPPDPAAVVRAAAGFTHPDSVCQLDAWWDLWQFDGDWRLAPAGVSMLCFGPDFAASDGDHLRLDLGLESMFLPQPDLPGSPRLVESNVRSLLHLARDLDQALASASRRLWSESGENFIERLQAALESSH
jgi:hypothetical protein